VGRDAAGSAGAKAGAKSESDGKKKSSKASAKDAAPAVDIVAELDMARRQLVELTAEPEMSDVFEEDEE
jgi:hypothetical protein